MTTLVFSKNRACQLELLLRSVNISVTVLYTCDQEFKTGYDKLISMYPSVRFIREENFKEQVLEVISDAKYVLFLVDDDVMISSFSEDCYEFREFNRNSDILCLNLRMSSQYRYNGVPILIDNTWEWNKYRFDRKNRARNWGYPMSVSSHIFRKDDIFPILLSREMNNPTTLERSLNRNPIYERPLMLCFDRPKFINNLANQVQTECPWPNLDLPVLELEKRFLQGERLSLTHIKDKAFTATDCFLMTEYEWEEQ